MESIAFGGKASDGEEELKEAERDNKEQDLHTNKRMERYKRLSQSKYFGKGLKYLKKLIKDSFTKECGGTYYQNDTREYNEMVNSFSVKYLAQSEYEYVVHARMFAHVMINYGRFKKSRGIHA